MKVINQLIAVAVVIFGICFAMVTFFYKTGYWEFFFVLNILVVYTGVKAFEISNK